MTMQSPPETLESVRSFWNSHPCGAHLIDEPLGTPRFFEKYADFRYRSEFHLNDLVPFDRFAGKRVLEIGCGLGTDGVRFAHNGAQYTGVDLTEAAALATRQHFTTLGLTGAFAVQDAENLALAANQFDLVYSHGVLHHTPNLDRALQEVRRVLRPGGEIIVMLYHRRSFNYYVRMLAYHRLRLLAYAATRPLLDEDRRQGIWEQHYQNLRRMGPRYLSTEVFPHHCADGPDCPIAYSFTEPEIHQRFGPYFTNLRVKIAHLPIHNSVPGFPRAAERARARRVGWYAFIFGTKR